MNDAATSTDPASLTRTQRNALRDMLQGADSGTPKIKIDGRCTGGLERRGLIEGGMGFYNLSADGVRVARNLRRTDKQGAALCRSLCLPAVEVRS